MALTDIAHQRGECPLNFDTREQCRFDVHGITVVYATDFRPNTGVPFPVVKRINADIGEGRTRCIYEAGSCYDSAFTAPGPWWNAVWKVVEYLKGVAAKQEHDYRAKMRAKEQEEEDLLLADSLAWYKRHG